MITRMVMMKMMRSTNITSTRGVTLMSAIIPSPSSSPPTLIDMRVYSSRLTSSGLARSGGRRLDRRTGRLVHTQAHLGTCNQVRMQLVGEVADALLHGLVAAEQYVVAEHRGY